MQSILILIKKKYYVDNVTLGRNSRCELKIKVIRLCYQTGRTRPLTNTIKHRLTRINNELDKKSIL